MQYNYSKILKSGVYLYYTASQTVKTL